MDGQRVGSVLRRNERNSSFTKGLRKDSLVELALRFAPDLATND